MKTLLAEYWLHLLLIPRRKIIHIITENQTRDEAVVDEVLKLIDEAHCDTFISRRSWDLKRTFYLKRKNEKAFIDDLFARIRSCFSSNWLDLAGQKPFATVIFANSEAATIAIQRLISMTGGIDSRLSLEIECSGLNSTSRNTSNWYHLRPLIYYFIRTISTTLL